MLWPQAEKAPQIDVLIALIWWLVCIATLKFWTFGFLDSLCVSTVSSAVVNYSHRCPMWRAASNSLQWRIAATKFAQILGHDKRAGDTSSRHAGSILCQASAYRSVTNCRHVVEVNESTTRMTFSCRADVRNTFTSCGKKRHFTLFSFLFCPLRLGSHSHWYGSCKVLLRNSLHWQSYLFVS